jgi:hypothetical protein
MARRTLPRWDPRWSDGCSVPAWLRGLVPLESPEAQRVCQEHDHTYYRGGSELDRLRGDLRFALGLLDTREAPVAERYYNAVRVFGGPHFRTPRVSWAWGGDYFAYEPEPAEEEP